ncbi:hypothetical protein AQ853_28195 [Burkholderia pseudomallei]|uniref:hypothetical protein n=1 Tax=Burkholderia pseudomallei TaxID=28450 RepID=UPI0007BEC6AC|nr:hypothetical protein [Burkholderia pseudomallei]OAB13674.1 hypothetical protein AQ853_28195 [Burkholderia pseudomallei]
MADRRQLEAELAKLDARLADERQAVSALRRQLDNRRLIPAPEARRAAVAAAIENTKRSSNTISTYQR